MPDIIITIVAFIILIGVLVFIHELGHFLAARWTGMRAEVFAVGMGPRLFGWNKLTGFTFGRLPQNLELGEHTDYRISAFPIGGYVKILGMVDESMDTDFANAPPQPWEFRSKKTWQKALVLSAGVIMNVLLAILLFAGLKLFHGDEYYATTTIGPLSNDRAQSVALDAGLRQGDRIVSINGDPVRYWQDIDESIYLRHAGEDMTFRIERNGAPMSITIPRSEIPTDIRTQGTLLIPDELGLTIRAVIGASPAYEAGLQDGDIIIAIDGKHISSSEEFISYVSDHKNRPLALTIRRDDRKLVEHVQPDKSGKVGVQIQPIYMGPTEQIRYGFFPAFAAGFGEVTERIDMMIELIGNLFAGKQKLQESVGGPVAIFKAAGDTFKLGGVQFLELMAYLSVMLAFLNILPFPALDGGHLVFVFIEGIMRREVPLKVRLAVQQVGFLLLLVFMIFVIYNDISRL